MALVPNVKSSNLFFFSLPVDRECKYLIDGIYRIGPSSMVVLQYFYLLDDTMRSHVRYLSRVRRLTSSRVIKKINSASGELGNVSRIENGHLLQANYSE